jgi:ubiquinone/menaquinone biosynthesis C-methylase UbiE
MAKAIASVPHAPGSVNFAASAGQLPFDDASVDALYSVSVLEHIPHPREIIPEIARVLVPNGLFVLTIDLDFRGDAAIGRDAYGALVAVLQELFHPICPVTTTHPADILDNTNGPFATPVLDGLRGRWWDLKQSIKPFLGRTKSWALPYHLAVEGFILEKRTFV